MTSFHNLYVQHAPAVRRFALFLSGDAALADDLAAETFVRAFVAAGEVRGSVRSWLLAIAHNLFREELRKRRPSAPMDPTLADPAAAPDARAENRAELRRALRALQQLPETDRAALVLRAVEELSHDEIAVALGLSPIAARVRVYRARARLTNLMKKEDEDGRHS